MGALVRLLSLGFSVTFTAAARGRWRLSSTPPHPFGLNLLLPLLLAAVILVAGSAQVRADTIFLNSYTDTTDFDSDRVDSIVVTVATTQRDRAKFTYTYGFGATNEFRNNSDLQYTWNLGPTPNDNDRAFYSTHFTNLYVYPWGSDNVAIGNATNSEHTVENIYWSGSVITRQDTNVVQVDTNVSYASFNPPWLGSAYTYTELVSNGSNTTKVSVRSDVMLITDAPAGGTGSALFKLTSGFAIPNYGYPDYTNGSALANCASQYTFAGQDPDANGVVWKVLTDGTNHPVNVAIKSDYTNAITNFTFNPGATRVQLTGLEWKSSNTNDTTWHTEPCYALKGTTVMFRVTTNMSGVVWPANLPLWSGGGATGTNTQFSITFNTISADTNGQWITATAGNTVSNQVVVYDFGIVPTADDTSVSPRVRSTIGVGEIVQFSVGFTPAGLSNNFPLSFTWAGTGTPDTNLDAGDLTTFSGQTLSAGCLPETYTVTVTLVDGINACASRSTNISVIKPTNAILLPLIYSAATSGLITNLNVGHTQYMASAVKRAVWQVQPTSVSFTRIKISEGAATNSWQGGATATWTLYTNGQWVAQGTVDLSNEVPNHPVGPWQTIVHQNAGVFLNVSDGYDDFGTAYGGTGVGAVSLSPAKTNIMVIPLRYQLAVQTNSFGSVTNTRIWGPDGAISVQKDGLGPFPTAFTNATTPLF